MRAGYTLAEVLMAMFLLATVMALALGLFFPTLWMFHAESGRNDVQQGVLLLTSRIRAELQNSACEWITLNSAGSALSLRRVSDAAPFDPISGAAQFESKFVTYAYEADQKRVVTRTWPPAPPDATALTRTYDFASPELVKLSEADLSRICATPHPKQRVLARNVESFSIYDQDPADPLLTPPFLLRVECALVNPGPGARKTERYALTVAVTPRSQRW